MIHLQFNANLMQEKARAVMAECEHIKNICRGIQEEAEAGRYYIAAKIDQSQLPGKADISDAVAFFRTMGFIVKVIDHERSLVSIKWNLNPEPLRDIDESLVEIINCIAKRR